MSNLKKWAAIAALFVLPFGAPNSAHAFAINIFDGITLVGTLRRHLKS
jgi:hypothetical protein